MLTAITICGKDCTSSLEYVNSKKLICLTPNVWGTGDIIVTTTSGGRGKCTVTFAGLEPEPVATIGTVVSVVVIVCFIFLFYYSTKLDVGAEKIISEDSYKHTYKLPNFKGLMMSFYVAEMQLPAVPSAAQYMYAPFFNPEFFTHRIRKDLYRSSRFSMVNKKLADEQYKKVCSYFCL